MFRCHRMQRMISQVSADHTAFTLRIDIIRKNDGLYKIKYYMQRLDYMTNWNSPHQSWTRTGVRTQKAVNWALIKTVSDTKWHLKLHERNTTCSYFSFCGTAAQHRPRPPHSWGFYFTHDNTPQSVGLLWTSDQLIRETSTWQHTTLTTNIHAPSRIWTHNLSRWTATDTLDNISTRKPGCNNGKSKLWRLLVNAQS